MARKLATEINARFGKEGEYQYKRYDIGVYLQNVIGFKQESRRYVAKVAKSTGDLSTNLRDGNGTQTYTFLNKFNEELFKIYLEDIKVVQTNLADKAILLSGTYDTREGKKYQYVDKNIATKSGSVYANGEFYIGGTQNPLSIDENGNPVLTESADYIFRTPTADKIYGVELKNKLKVHDDTRITGSVNIETDLDVSHSVTLGSSNAEDDELHVLSTSKFDKSLNIMEKYLFRNDKVEIKEAAELSKTLTVNKDTKLNANVYAVYDSVAKQYMITTNGNQSYTSNFEDNVLTGNLSVDGNTVIGKRGEKTTLDINSDTNLNGAFNITGDTVIDGILKVKRSAVIQDTLDVDGAATLADSLTVDGITNLNNILNVVREATFKNNVNINGDSTLKGSLNVALATRLASTLNVKGAANLEDSLTVALQTILNDTLTVAKKATFNNDVQIDQNLTVTENETVGGTLDVTGATTLSDILNVSKKATFKNDVQINGNETIGGTLGVTGATTLSDILNVVKKATFNDSVQIDKDLTVSGTTNLANILVKGGQFETIAVSGNGTIGGTLGVTGVTTLGDALNVTGATTLKSTLDVSSNTAIGGTLGVTDATTLGSTLGVTGATTLGSTLDVTDNTTIGGNLDVTGTTTLSSTLDVTDATTLGSTLNVTGATTLSNTLSVAKKATFKNDVQIDGNANIAGNETIGGTLIVTGAASYKAGMSIVGNTLIGGTLGVTGATTLSDILNVVKKATFNDSVQIDKNLTASGNGTIGGTLGVTGVTTLGDALNVTGATTLKSTLGVTGNTTIGGTLGVTGKATLGNGLAITGDTTATGSLNLDKSFSFYKNGSGDSYLFRGNSNGFFSDFATNTFGGNVLPSQNNTYTLGTESARWKEIYATKFSGAFEGNASSATKLETARTITIKGVQSADTSKTNNSVSTTFDGTKNIEFDISSLGYDASKIITGIIDIDRLPKGALDRLLPVANKAERLRLTIDDVQKGDTVQEQDTKLMYYVEDESKLGTAQAEEAFREYTVGHATAVPWTGIENKPDWVVNPQTLTINRVGKTIASYNTKDAKSIDIRQISIILNGGLHASKATTIFDTSTDKEITITPGAIGAAPEKGSTDIATLASTITLGEGGLACILQNNGTYQQRINIIDNATAGDNVYEFQQSSNSGTSFNTLMAILDDGSVKASKFIGAFEGSATKLGTADIGANDTFMYLKAGVATASTLTKGSGTKPVFFSSGKVTESTSNVGSNTNFMYMKDGTLTKSDANIAGNRQLMYLKAGVLTASNDNVADSNTLMYLKNGTLTASTGDIATTGTKLMYLGSGSLKESNASVGDTDTPVYMKAGTITTTGKKFSDYFKRSGTVINNPNASNFSFSNTVDGYLIFSNTGDENGVARGIGGVNGGTDGWSVRGYQTANNFGALEISVGDDGDEGIYVRQYTSGQYKLPFMNKAGEASQLTYREIILMEPGTGNSIFPGDVTATTFTGALSGNAATATTAQYLNTKTDAGYYTNKDGDIFHKRSSDTDYLGIYNKESNPVAKVYYETGNTEVRGTLKAGGLTTLSSGLKVSGRVANSGNDEGIVIEPASNGYAGLILGSVNAERSVFYLTNAHRAVWRYNSGASGAASFDIAHPKRAGVIAIEDNTSANNLINQLSEGTSDLTDEDFVITQYVGGGTTTNTYHRKKAKYIWNYIKNKNYYLPIAGGTMTGDITFQAIGDTAKSTGLHWTGSTDGADIYYRTDGADAGRLVLNITDNANARIDFALNGISKSYIDANGNFSGVSNLAEHVYSIDGSSTKTPMTFHWVGKDGQPTWMWGGADAANAYVYNPANFNVNSAYKLKDSGNGTDITASYSKAGLNYSEYTWLAGWNGYELRAINKNQFATAGHNHDTAYVKKSGDTMTGALNFANATWNKVGDDVAIGDHDVAGSLGVIGLNSTPKVSFVNSSNTVLASIGSPAANKLETSATSFKFGAATLEYDSTNKCINFTFA